ncbi:MAG TPA: MFS transporter [Candidatus Binataceae bacterium]|nr:MFS transporter [Candidatus Binataceae bacterium]
MAAHDKGSWLIVGVLFVTLFLIWGPINASGVFFLSVVKHFGWSRALFSALVATAPLAAGLCSPFIGSLIDRIGARRVMIAGAAMVAVAYVALSRANSAAAFFVIFILLGIGITASTIIPTALVITNWFRARRGMALGIAFAGIPLGGTGITIFANYVVSHYGFRAGYLAMAIPIVIVVIPLLVMFLKTWPEREEAGSLAKESRMTLPGLEVRQALMSRSFWMIAIAEVLFATAGVGIRVHLVPYLTGIGYAPPRAAEIFGAMFVFSAIGSFAIGPFADRFGGRTMLMAIFVAGAIGVATLLGASHFSAVAAFVVIFGLVRETPAVLLPIVIGESLGTRRLGSLLGIQAFFTTLGFAAGPILAGRIFDLSGAYSGALLLFVAIVLIAALAIRAALPLAKEQARIIVGETAAA